MVYLLFKPLFFFCASGQVNRCLGPSVISLPYYSSCVGSGVPTVTVFVSTTFFFFFDVFFPLTEQKVFTHPCSSSGETTLYADIDPMCMWGEMGSGFIYAAIVDLPLKFCIIDF